MKVVKKSQKSNTNMKYTCTNKSNNQQYTIIRIGIVYTHISIWNLISFSIFFASFVHFSVATSHKIEHFFLWTAVINCKVFSSLVFYFMIYSSFFYSRFIFYFILFDSCFCFLLFVDWSIKRKIFQSFAT